MQDCFSFIREDKLFLGFCEEIFVFFFTAYVRCIAEICIAYISVYVFSALVCDIHAQDGGGMKKIQKKDIQGLTVSPFFERL